jgi:hypothetical protein
MKVNYCNRFRSESYMKSTVRILLKIILLFNASVLMYAVPAAGSADDDIHSLWVDCKLEKILSFDVFNTALRGYFKTENIRKKNIITIIDFSKPSTDKRCFIINIDKKKLLYNCLVAHGKNSGDNYATDFSNESESLKSSLGFYLTAETYTGKHGYSLRLEGLEKHINDNARSREIVIHGADYVSQEFIDKYGRLGRSWGCPALPPEISKEVIDTISNGSCIFIYGPDKSYVLKSAFLKK